MLRTAFKSTTLLALVALAACASPAVAPAPMAAEVAPMAETPTAAPLVCNNGECTVPGS